MRVLNTIIGISIVAVTQIYAEGVDFGVVEEPFGFSHRAISPTHQVSATTTQPSKIERNYSSIKSEIQNTIRDKLSSPYKSIIKQLYANNGYNPLWVGGSNSSSFSQLLQALDNPYFNYLGKDLNRKNIKYLSFNIDNGNLDRGSIPKAQARLDVLMSDSYIKMLHFLIVGDTDWALVKKKLESLKDKKDVHATWEIKPREIPSINTIISSIKSGRVREMLNSSIPYEQRYKDLVDMLSKYRRMPNFGKIHDGKRLKRGSNDSRISQIKRLLKFFGDYPKNGRIDNDYDRRLSKAVLSFKKRMNIEQGDYIDNKTIFYMNKSRDYYLKSIISTLEILKLYPHKLESSRIEINIPEFAMRLFRDDRVVFKSDVIVGRIDRPTPIFKAYMSYMVLNPTWTIPDNLVKRDLIPALKIQPDYLQKHDIHVYTSYDKNAKEVELDLDKLFSYEHSDKKVPYRFVQFPSDKNALGRVKFMFPNKYSVYLHDTDNKALFGYRYRVFSSGCMRIKKPFGLVDMLLPFVKGRYSESKIEEILSSNKPKELVLQKRIPVYTTYFTASRENGKDMFFYDIYMYAQIVWESMSGHKKSSFTIPKNRLITIKKRGSRIYVERHR